MSGHTQAPPVPHAWGAAAFFFLSVAPYVLLYSAYPTSHLWLPDDAFYYFEIARNLGSGAGSTFDGINPTNGYHPLWQGLLGIAAALIPSRDALVTVTLLFQCALVWATWTITYRLLALAPDATSMIAAGVVAILVTWNYYLSKTVINGLESALFLACCALLL